MAVSVRPRMEQPLNIIQIASAVYLLALVLSALAVYGKYVVTGKRTSATLGGFPAFVAVVAIVVCAITVLVEVA